MQDHSFWNIDIGQVVVAVSFIGGIVWAHFQMKARLDQLFSTLNRHEETIDNHSKRLIEHGEWLASIGHDRRHRVDR